MNRKNFLKTLGIGVLSTIIMPKAFFSKGNHESVEPKKESISQKEIDAFEFIVRNKNGEHKITAIGDHGHEINHEISLIRLQTLHAHEGHCFSLENPFKFNGMTICTQVYLSTYNFPCTIKDIPYRFDVKNINEFEFDFEYNDLIKVTLFKHKNINHSRTLNFNRTLNNDAKLF